MESIHQNAFKAAEAARCAEDQGKFWEMHDQLFANQRALAEENLRSYAEGLALDLTQYDQCMSTNKHAERIRADMALAGSMQVRGTPNFWMGVVDSKDPKKITLTRNLRGARGYEDFKTNLDALLEEAAK